MDVSELKQLDSIFSTLQSGMKDELASTSRKFIEIMFQLVDKLIVIFRKHDALLRKIHNDLGVAVGSDNTPAVIKAFMEVMGPQKANIVKCDPAVIMTLQKLSIFRGVDLASDWGKLSEKTRNVLFSYIGHLVVTGSEYMMQQALCAPLTDAGLRRKLIEATVSCEREFTDAGNDVNADGAYLKLAELVNSRLKDAGIGGK
jgi:hypothetical protein